MASPVATGPPRDDNHRRARVRALKLGRVLGKAARRGVDVAPFNEEIEDLIRRVRATPGDR